MRQTTLSIALFVSFFLLTAPATAQNITPRPTTLSAQNAPTPVKRPTALRTFEQNMTRVLGARLEAAEGDVAVFIQNSNIAGNRRLYYFQRGSGKMVDTLEDGLPGSVRISEDGRLMVFLHDELAQNGREINGDRTGQTVLRMYHFNSGQKINIGIPARSATPRPDESRSQFEYHLDGHTLMYSSSTTTTNSSREEEAPWHIVDMLDVIYRIEGTPTPTRSPTPSSTPTPQGTAANAPSPSPTPPPTATPTFNLALRNHADINNDGTVDPLDLLIFEKFWKVENTPTPIPEG